MVTARHAIAGPKGIEKYATDGQTIVRLNDRQHRLPPLSIPLADWIPSDDERIDVAIAPCPIDVFTQYDHLPISSDMFVDAGTIRKEQIGAGDNLFFPGLFTGHVGEKANAPIVRVGNISAMPGEDLKTEGSGYLRPAYLVEALDRRSKRLASVRRNRR